MKKKMIDTICLLVPLDKIKYTKSSMDWSISSKTGQYTKYILNPNNQDKENSYYFPRLTKFNKMFSQDANLRIEFSVPKLLYLNNLEEVEEKDFSNIVNTLSKRLEKMGILIEQEVLETASVSSVHFSKNLDIKNGYRVNYLISEINKVNLKKSFDFAKVRFINDGQSLYAHTNSHEFVIYDKISDLKKEKSRAIDKDQTSYQKDLYVKLNKDTKLKEILRFEIRLNKKNKMNEVLERLGYDKNPSFRDIFKEEISRKVIISYWEKIIKERSLGIFLMPMSNKDTLQSLIKENPKIKPKQAIYLVGLSTLSKEENGIRQLRSILSKTSNDRTWYRIADDMKKINSNMDKDKLRNWVVQIDEALKDYKPYKI